MDTQPERYEAKADFSGIYNRADPRAYFRTLGALDYEIPRHGVPVFERLLDAMGGREGKTVLDVCCSYGVNAAMLNHDIDLEDLGEHYASVGAVDATSLDEIDRDWFASRRRADAVRTVGLDVAENAVRYATSVGLLDRGVVANLETSSVDADDLEALGSADLVTVTGGIGYIGERTLRTVAEASGDDPPWIAALSLRWLDFEPIARSLDGIGFVTESVPGYCVPQRRFAGDEERRAAYSGLRERGLDPSPELQSDAHFAELFVVRPTDAVREAPIDDVLGPLAG
ncbi:MAG: hypothetical protein ACRDWE_08345 [Acidimicrobiales bacterium]